MQYLKVDDLMKLPMVSQLDIACTIFD